MTWYCTFCDLNWPTVAWLPPARTCPVCSSELTSTEDIEPMTEAQARAVVMAHADARRKYETFEAYYEKTRIDPEVAAFHKVLVKLPECPEPEYTYPARSQLGPGGLSMPPK